MKKISINNKDILSHLQDDTLNKAFNMIEPYMKANDEAANLAKAFLKDIKDKEVIEKIQKMQSFNLFLFKSKDLTDGLPILCYACKTGNIPLTMVLLNKFKLDVTQIELTAAYYYACASAKREHQLIISHLQKNGIQLPPNKRKKYFIESESTKTNTLLYDACLNGQIEIVIVQMLNGLSKKELNDTSNENSRTPLHAAAMSNQIEIVKLLVQNKADLNMQDKNGVSPLLAALKANNFDIATYLINQNADLNLIDNDKNNALLTVCDGNNINHLYEKRIEMVKLIISKIDKKNRIKYINQKGPLKKTALINSVSTLTKADIAIPKILLENGADVNCNAYGGVSLLGHACNTSNYELAELGIEYKADVNHIDQGGYSYLYWACNNRDERTAKLLLEHGAQPYQKNVDLLTRLIREGAYNMVALLVEHDKKLMEQGIIKSDINDDIAWNSDHIDDIVADYNKINDLVKEPKRSKNAILERFKHLIFVCESKQFTEHQINTLVQSLLYQHEKLFLIFACGSYEDQLGTLLIEKILQLQMVATIENCGSRALLAAIWQSQIQNVNYLLENGARISDALYFACLSENKNMIKNVIQKVDRITLNDLLAEGINPALRLKFAAMINDIVHENEHQNEHQKEILTATDAANGNLNSCEDNHQLNVENVVEKDVSPFKTCEDRSPLKTCEDRSPLKTCGDSLTPAVIDFKPIKQFNLNLIAKDPKENLKVLKLAFANLIDEEAITWEDQNTERRYIIRLPVDHDVLKNLIPYLKKNSEKMHVNITVVSDIEVHVIATIDQQIIIPDVMKERITKFVNKQTKEIEKQNQEQPGNVTAPATSDHFDHLSHVDQTIVFDPNTNVADNHFAILAEDEMMNPKAIIRLISAITQMNIRLPLTIEQQRKNNWSIVCKLNQYGIGSKIFFNALVNSINQIFKEQKVSELVAKQFDMTKNEIKVILYLTDENIQTLNKNIIQVQQQFQQDYTEKLAEMQTVKPSQDDQNIALKLEKINAEDSENSIHSKDDDRAADNARQSSNQIICTPIPYQIPRPKDLIFCELHQNYLRDAEKSYRKTHALYLAGHLDLASELELLSHHIYIRLLKMINVLYIHYSKLNIPCVELERIRLLFTHRLDFMRAMHPSDHAYFDSNNNNSIYALLDDACNDLNAYYAEGRPIVLPISFAKNRIYCDYFGDITNITNNVQTPRHVEGAYGIFNQLINTLLELQYKTSADVMFYHLDSDARKRDELHALLLQVGLLVRQLREQAYHYCQINLNITLSFSAYRSSLMAHLEKELTYKLPQKGQYQQLLPYLLEINISSSSVLNSVLQRLNQNEMLLLCIEFRNFISHKSIETSLILERLSREFYLIVIRHLTAHLLPGLQDLVKKVPANTCVQPILSSMFQAENSNVHNAHPETESAPKGSSKSTFDKK